MYVLLSSLNVSQKAILLMSDNKFHQSRHLISQITHKTNELIFRKFCPNFEKIANRSDLARYCDESNDSFETLPELFYGTLNDI